MGNNFRRAFTVVELITVTAIIAVLVAILLPSLRMVRELANRIQCSANLKTWGAACLGFAANHKGNFPAAYGFGQLHFKREDPWDWVNHWNAIWTGWKFYLVQQSRLIRW